MTFKHLPKIDSIYRNSNNIRFRVLKLAHVDHDPWIEYENIKTKQHYSCRISAFMDRFSLVDTFKPWTRTN